MLMNKVMIIAISFPLLLGCNNEQTHLSGTETLLTDTTIVKTDSVISEKKYQKILYLLLNQIQQ